MRTLRMANAPNAWTPPRLVQPRHPAQRGLLPLQRSRRRPRQHLIKSLVKRRHRGMSRRSAPVRYGRKTKNRLRERKNKTKNRLRERKKRPRAAAADPTGAAPALMSGERFGRAPRPGSTTATG